ncbi:MrpF/PhaF family protein [Streptomyces sp. NPDC003015]
MGATVWGVATGPLGRRVVAQNLCTALACPALLLLSQGYDRPSYGDRALLLALLGPVGTLVFARLLADELAEDTVLYVAASAVTAAAVLRVADRVFFGLGPVPRSVPGTRRPVPGSGPRPGTGSVGSRTP